MQSRPTILLVVFLLLGSTALAENNFRVHQLVGDPSLLEAGDWWNLYFSDKNDPLNRSIKAVKVLHVSNDHRGWVMISYPKSRDEHFSILNPAAKASDNDSINKSDALAQWEETVNEWNTVWVNLDHVVSASLLATNPSGEDEENRVVPDESGDGKSVDKAGSDPSRLASALTRINERLKHELSVLQPTPLTEEALRRAIASEIDNLANGNTDHKAFYTAGLQKVLATNELPAGVRLHLRSDMDECGSRASGEMRMVTLKISIELPKANSLDGTDTFTLSPLTQKFRVSRVITDPIGEDN